MGEEAVIIAIDGPAASGKSTVARTLARQLAVGYLDTGAMYRAVALAALRGEVPLTDEAALEALAQEVELSFAVPEGETLATRIMLGGEDVSEAIREPDVDASVSAVARVPGVRRAMVAQQRALASEGTHVVEGRDIGTVVFPDSLIKVFLTASDEERARRRRGDLTGQGYRVAQETVKEDLNARDHKDSSRQDSPLSVADDAVVLDTTALSIEEVVAAIAVMVEES